MAEVLPYICITPKWGSRRWGCSEELRICIKDILGMAPSSDEEGNEYWLVTLAMDGETIEVPVKETPEDILKKIMESQSIN